MVLGVEFFTRSGFRWDGAKYLRTRLFDFVAIVPALALVNQGFAGEGVWVWLVLIGRAARVVDRLLGDGFVRRTILVVVGAFEEEITYRVLERIVERLQADMDRASFSHGVAEALLRNKASVMQRVRASTPREGFVPGLAHLVGLDAALERAEERTYDAVVEIIDSEEVYRAVRDSVNSLFSHLLVELGQKSWHQYFGIRGRRAKQEKPGTSTD